MTLSINFEQSDEVRPKEKSARIMPAYEKDARLMIQKIIENSN